MDSKKAYKPEIRKLETVACSYAKAGFLPVRWDVRDSIGTLQESQCGRRCRASTQIHLPCHIQGRSEWRHCERWASSQLCLLEFSLRCCSSLPCLHLRAVFCQMQFHFLAGTSQSPLLLLLTVKYQALLNKYIATWNGPRASGDFRLAKRMCWC